MRCKRRAGLRGGPEKKGNMRNGKGKAGGVGGRVVGGGEGLKLQLSQQQQLLRDSSHMCSHEWLRPEPRWTHSREPRRSTMSSAHSYAGDTREC